LPCGSALIDLTAGYTAESSASFCEWYLFSGPRPLRLTVIGRQLNKWESLLIVIPPWADEKLFKAFKNRCGLSKLLSGIDLIIQSGTQRLIGIRFEKANPVPYYCSPHSFAYDALALVAVSHVVIPHQAFNPWDLEDTEKEQD
jgi:hypothetical protein